MRAALTLVMTVLTIGLGGCSPAATPATSPSPSVPAIAGTYRCGPADDPDQDLVEFRADGMVTITQPEGSPGTTTYRFVRDRGAINTLEGEDQFAFDGERILFSDGFVCTPVE